MWSGLQLLRSPGHFLSVMRLATLPAVRQEVAAAAAAASADSRASRLGFKPLYPGTNFILCRCLINVCHADQEVPVVNWEKQVVGQVVLPGHIFGLPIRKDIVQRVVVWQLAKRRQGTSKVKTRAEVSGTTKKMYAQKGAEDRLCGEPVLTSLNRHWWCTSWWCASSAVPTRWCCSWPSTARL